MHAFAWDKLLNSRKFHHNFTSIYTGGILICATKKKYYSTTRILLLDYENLPIYAQISSREIGIKPGSWGGEEGHRLG